MSPCWSWHALIFTSKSLQAKLVEMIPFFIKSNSNSGCLYAKCTRSFAVLQSKKSCKFLIFHVRLLFTCLSVRNCFHRLEKKIANSPTAYLSFLLRKTTTFTIIGSHYYFYWEKFWHWVNGLTRNLIDRMVENYVLRNVFNEPNTIKLQISVSLSKHKRPWVWKFWTSLRVSYLLFFKFR